jgi:hypothetical protein
MQRNSFLLVGALSVTGLLFFQGTARGAAQEAGKETAAKESRWSGTIVRSNDKVSTLTVRKGTIEKIVHYDSATKWTEGTKDIDRAAFKDGDRVICLGTYNDKGEFTATRVDKRKPGGGLFH